MVSLFLTCLGLLPGRGESAPARNTAKAAVALTHGVLAFEEGDYQRAADLLEQAVESDPGEGSALHWLGLAYLKLGRVSDALPRLEASLKADRASAAGKRRVRADLQLARRLASRGADQGSVLAELAKAQGGLPFRDPLAPRFWSAQAGLALNEDSNPGLLPQIFTGLPLLGNGPHSAESDTAAQLDLRLDLVPFYDRNGWSLGALLEGSQWIHQDFVDLDMTLVHAHVSLARGTDPRGYISGPLGSVAVPRGASRISLVLEGGGFDLQVGADAFLRAAEGGVSLLWRETFKTATRFDIAARNRSFQREGPDPHRRSGGESTLEVSQYLFLAQPNRFLRLGALAGERGGGRDFQSSFTGSVAEVSLPLSEPWLLLLTGSWRRENFDRPESRLGASGPTRDDELWTFAIATVRRVNDHLRWTTNGSYFRNDSNLDLALGGSLFDYRRTLVTTGFIWTFQ